MRSGGPDSNKHLAMRFSVHWNPQNFTLKCSTIINVVIFEVLSMSMRHQPHTPKLGKGMAPLNATESHLTMLRTDRCPWMYHFHICKYYLNL